MDSRRSGAAKVSLEANAFTKSGLSKVSRIRTNRSARFANDAEDPGVDGALTGLWPEILLDLCAIANALTDSDSCSKIGRDPSTPVPLSCRKTGYALS